MVGPAGFLIASGVASAAVAVLVLWPWRGRRRLPPSEPVAIDLPPATRIADRVREVRTGRTAVDMPMVTTPEQALKVMQRNVGKMESTSGRIVDTEGPAPDPEPLYPGSGQHKGYWVLTKEELAKGYTRPFREAYRHVGVRPARPTRPLTEDELRRFGGTGYVAYEEYPKGERVAGRFWTAEQLRSGCGSETRMGWQLCATYARDGATLCSNCNAHFPVAEFVWVEDGQVVGS